LAGIEDERIPRLHAVVALGPAEDLAVEVEDLGPAGVVQQRPIHGERHVVEPWQVGLLTGCAHESSFSLFLWLFSLTEPPPSPGRPSPWPGSRRPRAVPSPGAVRRGARRCRR